jgi:hypothetical protein
VLLVHGQFGNREGQTGALVDDHPSIAIIAKLKKENMELREQLSSCSAATSDRIILDEQLAEATLEKVVKPSLARTPLTKQPSHAEGVDESVFQFPWDPFGSNSSASNPHHVIWAAPTAQNTKLAFGIVADQQWGNPWPGGPEVKCPDGQPFSIPCSVAKQSCAEIARVLHFECLFDGGVATKIPFPIDCSQKNVFDCDENRGHDLFHPGSIVAEGDKLTLVCPIPKERQADLKAGVPINVTLLQNSNPYTQRVVYPATTVAGKKPKHVELSAIMFFNVAYANNQKVLKEWLVFHMMQGVEQFYVYYMSGKPNLHSHLSEIHVSVTDDAKVMDCYKDTTELEARRACAADPLGIKVLKEYRDAGIVTLVHWPHKALCDADIQRKQAQGIVEEGTNYLCCDIPTCPQVSQCI